MNTLLTNTDIKKYLGKDCKIISYRQLNDISNFDQFMSNILFLIILYEHKKNVGHWCVIIKDDVQKIFEFFDPYGTQPDKQLLDLPIRIRNSLGQDYPTLAAHLYNSNRQIVYNSHKLQQLKIGINTCGKWVLTRCMMYKLPINSYASLFKGDKDKQVQNLYNSIKKSFI